MVHFSQIPIVEATVKKTFSGFAADQRINYQSMSTRAQQDGCAAPRAERGTRAFPVGIQWAPAPGQAHASTENRIFEHKRDDRRDRTTDSESTKNFQSIYGSDDGATPDALATRIFLATPDREMTQ